MIHKIIKEEIRVPGTLKDTCLETYLLSVTDKFTVQERPLILVCPGGGYNHTSDREAEIVAMQFNAMGYHTAVLRYSCAPAVFPTALLELTKAVAFLREHAGEYCIDPERIAVLGFSAAGHLAASLGVYWNTEWFAQIREENGVNLTAEQIRPDGLVLAYPVITSGEFAHRGSFDDLLGEARCRDPFWLTRMSLEKQDLKDIPTDQGQKACGIPHISGRCAWRQPGGLAHLFSGKRHGHAGSTVDRTGSHLAGRMEETLIF